MTGLKDRKICRENVSLSLAKGEPDEKNEWKFSNQSVEVMYPSKIYLRNRKKKSFFFSVLYLEYDFMMANIVRLNLAVLKILETSYEHTSGRVLC